MRHDDDLIRRTIRPSLDLDPTRARPEPWFVGNGRGLMIVVLSACAVLLAVRVVTTVWMAEEAWHWWNRPSRSSPVPMPAPPAPAPPLIGPPDTAQPVGNPGAAFSPDDYPKDALRREQQGRTVARLGVGADGRVTSCRIEESSGVPSLDTATCARGATVRFRPARDTGGRAIAGSYRLPVRWQLPVD